MCENVFLWDSTDHRTENGVIFYMTFRATDKCFAIVSRSKSAQIWRMLRSLLKALRKLNLIKTQSVSLRSSTVKFIGARKTGFLLLRVLPCLREAWGLGYFPPGDMFWNLWWGQVCRRRVLQIPTLCQIKMCHFFLYCLRPGALKFISVFKRKSEMVQI